MVQASLNYDSITKLGSDQPANFSLTGAMELPKEVKDLVSEAKQAVAHFKEHLGDDCRVTVNITKEDDGSRSIAINVAQRAKAK